MKVKVTQAHIDAGECGNAELCPIAFAIKEASGHDHVVVFRNINIGDRYYEPTPFEVFAKLQGYDETGKMEPFDFEIKDLL